MHKGTMGRIWTLLRNFLTLLIAFILIAIPPIAALAEPASFFDTDLTTGIDRFKQVVTDANSSAVFYERTFDSSMSTNVFEVQNGSGGSAWVRVTQDGSAINFDSPEGSTGYYFHDWSVSISSWAEAYDEGITFEFFTDSSLTTPMNVNAFGIYTYHWGTCCTTSNPTPSGGTQDGTAIYSIFDADPTTYHELIGNITETISPDTHFVGEIDDRDEGFQKVTVIPNGDGELFAMGGYIVFSWVSEGSVPPGSGSTPSIPPGNPDLTAATDLGDSNSDNLTSDTTPDFEITYDPQNDIDFVNLYSGPSSTGPWTLIATSSAAGTTNETTVTLTSSSLPEGSHYIAGRVENGYWHDESDPSPTPLYVTIDSTAPTMDISASEVSDGDTSNDPTLSLTFASSESTTTFDAGDVTVTNGSLSGFSGSGTTYTATLTPNVDGPVTVNVPAGSYTDTAGNNNLAADEFNWTSDQTPPTVTFNPLDGETIVANEADIILTLSEPIRRASDNFELTDLNVDDHITLKFDDASGTDIPFDATIDSDKEVITVDPDDPLPSNRFVYVAIGSTVEDYADNPLADDSATFISADETLPTLSSSSPSDGQSDVDINTDLTLTFSEAVDAESGNIEVRKSSDGSLFESIDVTGAQVAGSGTDTITVDITGPLASSTDYYVLIDDTAFDDADGNSYAGISDQRKLNFLTEFIDTTPPVVTIDPADGASDVPVTSNITISFDEAVRNLDDSPITDSNVDSLITLKDTNSSGSDIPFDATIDGAKQVITINPTSNFASEQVVYVAIGASVEDDSDNAISAESATFTVEDILSPTLLSTDPADGSNTVAPNDDLIMTFSEPVDAEFGSITIYNASDDSIFESMSVTSTSQVSGSGTDTIVVNPSNTLANNSSYYVQIASTAFDDPSGNSYAGIADTTSWDFTTLASSGTISCSDVTISATESSSGSTSASCSGSPTDYSVTQPSLGVSSNSGSTLTFDPNGEFEYLGDGDTETTQGDFTYTANDGSEVSNVAQVNVTVTGTNDAPQAVDDSVSTDEDTAFTTPDLVAANDSDPDTSDSLSVVGIDTSGTSGSVTDNSNGTFTYNPNGQFESLAVGESATDSFTYTIEDGSGAQDTATVTVTITGVNDSPSAVDDTTPATDEDTSFRTADLVAANDTDPDSSDSLTVTGIDTTNVLGTVVSNGNGTFDFYPDGQYEFLGSGDTEIDTFEYTVADGNGGSDTATVTLEITGINDAPSISSCEITPDPAFTDDDLAANYSGWDDPEGDPPNVNFAWYVNSTRLTSYDNANTLPADQFSHSDDVELECTPVDGEGLSGTTLSDALTISNSTPNAVDDSDTTVEDNPVTVDVLDNDTDADASDTLTITAVTQGSDGTVTNNTTDLTYEPDANFYGTDSFTYTIEDDQGASDTATVTITVTEATDMAVLGNGQLIANGDSTPSGTDDTDFGTVPLFLETVEHTFTIENQGPIDLALTGSPRVQISGPQQSDFTVTDQPSSPITSGSTTTFSVLFDPSAAGVRSATISIETNDINTAYSFEIQGNGTPRDLDGDGVMDTTEGNGDRDGDGVNNYQDYDPTGYFYDQGSGEIIPGGQISVSGPGSITIIEDGSDGYYQFTTDGTPGEYVMSVSLPPGYEWSTGCLQGDPPPFDPTGQPEPLSLGNGEDGNSGFLTSNACTNFYLTFDLETGDPAIINNNFPLNRRPLPATGFSQNAVTHLSNQPQEKQYHQFNGMWLEIPSIGVKTDLVGIPSSDGEWDVTWLGDRAGYLSGTAFPTWQGNTVITGHVWDSNNLPGKFIDVRWLSYGDLVKIHAWGQIYTYQVQSNERISPVDAESVFQHEKSDWVTLLTCEGYNSREDSYSSRRIVRAVLIQVNPE